MSNFIFENGKLNITDNFQDMIDKLRYDNENDVLVALELSTEKWNVLYASKSEMPSSMIYSGEISTCALCFLFHSYQKCGIDDNSCPISEFTGEGQCGSTPHSKATYELSYRSEYGNTKKMLDFLVKVRDWYKREKLNE